MALIQRQRKFAENRQRRPGSFGTYLETIQGLTAKADDLQSRVLTILASQGPCTIAELLEAGDAQLTDMLNALRSLREFGLVSSTDPIEGKFEVTPSGRSTAQAIH